MFFCAALMFRHKCVKPFNKLPCSPHVKAFLGRTLNCTPLQALGKGQVRGKNSLDGNLQPHLQMPQNQTYWSFEPGSAMSGNQASCNIGLLRKRFAAFLPCFCSSSRFISFVVALSSTVCNKDSQGDQTVAGKVAAV